MEEINNAKRGQSNAHQIFKAKNIVQTKSMQNLNKHVFGQKLHISQYNNVDCPNQVEKTEINTGHILQITWNVI